MAEQVYDKAQIGPQAGTFAAPGASVPAITILPVTEAPIIELDRATQYPTEDYGANEKNHAGRGYHGVRGASLPLNGELTFEQAEHLFEMHYAGSVVKTGSGPYTSVYLLEKGAPTLVPYTVETGSETSQDQWEAVGVLIDELTLGFDDLDAPGAHPWTFQATCKALDRVVAAVTGSLSSTAVETLQGIYSVFKEGTTGTAFASLSEIAASFKSFSITTRRSLTFRAYGGTGDTPVGYGYSDKTVGEVTAKFKIGATTKTNIHDIWAASGSVLGERRWRVSVTGSGTNIAHLDMRIGEQKVAISTIDGERVYEVSAETVSDATLLAQAGWTMINGIADLTP